VERAPAMLVSSRAVGRARLRRARCRAWNTARSGRRVPPVGLPLPARAPEGRATVLSADGRSRGGTRPVCQRPFAPAAPLHARASRLTSLHRFAAPPLERFTASPLHRFTPHASRLTPHASRLTSLHRFAAPPLERFTASLLHHLNASTLQRFNALKRLTPHLSPLAPQPARPPVRSGAGRLAPGYGRR